MKDAKIASLTFGSYYTYLWVEKFDFDPVEWTIEYEAEIEHLREIQKVEALFIEGQYEYL